MSRAKREIVHLLHGIIRANRTKERGKRLLGSPSEKSATVTRAHNLLALIKLNETITTPASCNPLIATLRKSAQDKIRASQRLLSIERLCVLAGILRLTELGTEPLDDLIRAQMSENPQKETSPTVEPAVPPQAESFDEELKRLTAQFEQQGKR
jgi:hypothetical protein